MDINPDQILEAIHINLLGDLRMRNDNNSVFKGVTWRKDNNKWRAYISFNKKWINLGHFNDPKEAAEIYNKAALQLF